MVKQLNFVKILEKKIDNLNKYKLVVPKKRSPDKLDKEITGEIVKFLKKKNILNSYGGEWEYLNEKKRKNFITNLKNINTIELEIIFSNLFQNDASYGIVTPSFKDVKDLDLFKSQILNDIDAAIEFANLSNVMDININSSIGNPFGMMFKNKIVMPDTPRHFYFSQKIKKIMFNRKKFSILEIGGGYGGFVRMLSKLNKKITYYSVDLPEGCLIQYYFLKKCGLKPKIVDDISKIRENRINIIPYENELKILRKIKNVDILFNSRSFSEMNANILNKYFKIINQTLKPLYIYHENSNYLLFPKSKRHIEILGKDFNFNEKLFFLKNISISPFSGGSGRYREFLYKRK